MLLSVRKLCINYMSVTLTMSCQELLRVCVSLLCFCGSLGTCAWDLSLGIFRLGILRLGTCVGDFSLGNFSFRPLAWEL